jgi:hypothetical protein
VRRDPSFSLHLFGHNCLSHPAARVQYTYAIQLVDIEIVSQIEASISPCVLIAELKGSRFPGSPGCRPVRKLEDLPFFMTSGLPAYRLERLVVQPS